MHFGHKSRAITLDVSEWNYPIAIPYHSSLIPMFMQSLKNIGRKVLKLEYGNEAQSILTYIKGHNPLEIPYHSSRIPMSMQSLKKTGQKELFVWRGIKSQSISSPLFLFSILGIVGRVLWIGKICVKIGNSWEIRKVQYLSPNVHKLSCYYLASLENILTLIQGLNIFFFKASFKNFPSLFF